MKKIIPLIGFLVIFLAVAVNAAYAPTGVIDETQPLITADLGFEFMPGELIEKPYLAKGYNQVYNFENGNYVLQSSEEVVKSVGQFLSGNGVAESKLYIAHLPDDEQYDEEIGTIKMKDYLYGMDHLTGENGFFIGYFNFENVNFTVLSEIDGYVLTTCLTEDNEFFHCRHIIDDVTGELHTTLLRWDGQRLYLVLQAKYTGIVSYNTIPVKVDNVTFEMEGSIFTSSYEGNGFNHISGIGSFEEVVNGFDPDVNYIFGCREANGTTDCSIFPVSMIKPRMHVKVGTYEYEEPIGAVGLSLDNNTLVFDSAVAGLTLQDGDVVEVGVYAKDLLGNVVEYNWTFEVDLPGALYPPVFAEIPDLVLEEDEVKTLDLWDYVTDNDTDLDNLTFEVVSQTDTDVAECEIVSGRYVECEGDDEGVTEVTLRVTDVDSQTDETVLTVHGIEEDESPRLWSIPDFNLKEGETKRLDLWEQVANDNTELLCNANDVYDCEVGNLTFTPGVDFVKGHVGNGFNISAGNFIGYDANLLSLEQGSIDMWVKPNWDGNENNAEPYGNYFYYGHTGSWFNAQYLTHRNSKLVYAMRAGAGAWAVVVYDVSHWDAGEWHHVATTWGQENGSYVMELFVDGQEVGRYENVEPIFPEARGTFTIGGNSGWNFFDGVIDEVRISGVMEDNFINAYDEDALDNLTFEVVSQTDTDVATCELVDDRYLDCTGDDEGVTEVTLRVTDLDNLTAEDMFDVNVEEETDNGNSGNGGSSGGSSRGTPYTGGDCLEVWTCGGWSDCVNGTQTLDCVDLNQCGTEEKKPVTELECKESLEEVKGDQVEVHDETTPLLDNEEKPGILNNVFTWIVLAVLGLIVVFLLLSLFLRKRK